MKRLSELHWRSSIKRWAAGGLTMAFGFTAAVAAGQSAAESGAPALLSGLQWRSIGPLRGGRSLACAGSPSRPHEYYFGAVGGGLWKTDDGGNRWRPITDGQIASSSVGAVAVSESNPDVVYLGMGETQLRGNVMQGDGVYRSTDAGQTWTHVGLSDTHAIARIRIHPSDADIAYVAALGHPYGENTERGVFRTTDGGESWQKVLYRSERAGAVDLSIDRHDPRVLYAATWEVYRKPWLLWSGGAGSGLFKSEDGGDSWVELTRNSGLPKGVLGKIAVVVSPADSRRVYALVEAEDGGVFRSDDAGATWTRVNDERDLRQRAFYFSRLTADPEDPDTLYALNFRLHKSTDGGRTYEIIATPHADQHDLWIDPNDPLRMVESSDGGGSVSINGGQSWTRQEFPTAQMYHVATTRDFPYHVCGAQQDNSTACVPSDAGSHLRNPRQEPGRWLYAVGGNESGHIVPHPEDPNIFYGGGQESYLTRYDRRTGQARDIKPYPRLYSGESAGSVPERWNWTFPIAVSPVDPSLLYAGSQHVWRTTDEGQTWARISPDLTRADPLTLGDSGGPLTKDQNGPEFFATIFTIAPSRLERDTLWVGSDDGRVHLTRDGGKSWHDITPPDMPEYTTVSLIDASPHRVGGAYLAGKRYRLDDRAPYLWKTADFGKSWVSINDGIPAGDFVHAVREDPQRQGLLFAGTEHGVHVSFDDGGRWQSLSANLPDTQVPDLVVEQSDLVIATHGRSFYILDGIESLRQLTPEVSRSPAHLFEPGPAYRRARPARIDVLLTPAAGEASLEIIDDQSRVIRRFSGDGLSKPGLNRVSWDLRYPGATLFPGMILRSANPERGPWAPPGNYTIRFTAGATVQERTLMLHKDPRLTGVTQADLDEQFRLALEIRDRTSAANEAVLRIRSLREQIDERMTRTSEPTAAATADRLLRELASVEEAIYQVKNQSPKDPLNFPIRLNNRIAALQRTVEAADARPTRQAYEIFEELSAELDGHLGRLEQALSADLAALNGQLTARGIESVQ